MQRKRWYWLLSVVGWLVYAPLAAAAPNGLPLAPFQARYGGFVDVVGVDMELRMQGKMDLSLSDAGNGRYRMQYEVKAVLGTVQAQANGEFSNNEIRPVSYEQTVTSLKKSHTQLTFNWGANTVRAVEDGEQKILPLSGRAVDPLSLHLLVMWDLQQGQKPRQYTLINGTKLRTYNVSLEGEETLKTRLGNLRTLRVTSTRDNKDNDRITTFWLAPELGYLPVQVVHQNKGKETLRMLLEEVKQDGPKTQISSRQRNR